MLGGSNVCAVWFKKSWTKLATDEQHFLSLDPYATLKSYTTEHQIMFKDIPEDIPDHKQIKQGTEISQTSSLHILLTKHVHDNVWQIPFQYKYNMGECLYLSLFVCFMKWRGDTTLGRKLPLLKTALPMPLRFYPNAAPQGRQRDHSAGISENCAFFDGQSTVPQVHIPRTDLDLPGSL